MKKIFSLFLIFISLTVSAQKADFMSDDLRVFELRGRVKSVALDYDEWLGKRIEFDEFGNITESDFEVEYDDNDCIERILSEEYIDEQKSEIDEFMEENGCERGEAESYCYGSIGPSAYSIEWQSGRPWRMHSSGYGNYGFFYEYGADGNMASGTFAAGLTGEGIKTYKYKYTKYDRYGNWTTRVFMNKEEHRTIEYYDFEAEFNALRENSTLEDVAEFIDHMKEVGEFGLSTEAVLLWNQRAITTIERSRKITEDVNKIINSEYATEDTRTAAVDKWNSVYFTKLNAEKEPTDIVNEILNSPLASDGLKITSQGYWNEFYKDKVDHATNPTEYASTIIDSPLMLEDYRQHILATVHNYELQHNVEGVTDYNALYAEANVKCGSYYVFNADERKKINYNADQYKRQTTNKLIVRSQELMKEDRLTESREEVLKALAIEPDYKSGIEQRAEVEYRILWKQILTYEAAVNTIDSYIKANPGSKYTENATAVRYLLEHLNHKDSGPTKLYKKMVKKGEIPELEKIMKTVQKCQKKDAK